MRVGIAAGAGVERQEQARLVDEVDAGFEIVAEPAHSCHVPREVIAELIFLLLRRLGRVDVLPDEHVIRECLIGIEAVAP